MRRGREYPEHPLVGVGAFIHNNRGRVLLIRRRFEPNRGRWSLPGGLVEVGERVEDAVRREIMEEVGIEIELEGLLQVADEIVPDGSGNVRYHYVLLDFLAKPIRGEIRLNEESDEHRWFRPEEVEGLDVSNNTKLIMKRYLGGKRHDYHWGG